MDSKLLPLNAEENYDHSQFKTLRKPKLILLILPSFPSFHCTQTSRTHSTKIITTHPIAKLGLFQIMHSTFILLTTIFQNIINSLNKTPSHRIIVLATDIIKVLDTVLRHILIQNI